jgi:hypothetical protein
MIGLEIGIWICNWGILKQLFYRPDLAKLIFEGIKVNTGFDTMK